MSTLQSLLGMVDPAIAYASFGSAVQNFTHLLLPAGGFGLYCLMLENAI